MFKARFPSTLAYSTHMIKNNVSVEFGSFGLKAAPDVAPDIETATTSTSNA
jgi:hypothetical protein